MQVCVELGPSNISSMELTFSNFFLNECMDESMKQWWKFCGIALVWETWKLSVSIICITGLQLLPKSLQKLYHNDVNYERTAILSHLTCIAIKAEPDTPTILKIFVYILTPKQNEIKNTMSNEDDSYSKIRVNFSAN